VDRFALSYDQRVDEERLRAALESLVAEDAGLEVYLFGSRAGDSYHAGSDWDLVFVSDRFGSVPFLRRGADLAWRLAESGFAAVDLICITPAELAVRRSESTQFAAALAGARRLAGGRMAPLGSVVARSVNRS
jgi:hypothetical protein